MSADQQEIIRRLQTYFSARPEVVLVFLFGSRAKNTARAGSDWDLGVYFVPETNSANEHKVWSDVERITGAETDLVTLNRAPVNVAWSIARQTPLVVKDRRKYLDFLIRTSHEANDWYRTAEDYHRVFMRSASLSREDRGRLEKIIQFFEVEISDFQKFEKMVWAEYVNERAKKREVERWVEQIINAVVDAAEIILASEKRVIPETYKEIIQTLGLIKTFSDDDLCQKLSRWTGLRNILAHEYLDYRWKNISQFIQKAKPELESFMSNLRQFVIDGD